MPKTCKKEATASERPACGQALVDASPRGKKGHASLLATKKIPSMNRRRGGGGIASLYYMCDPGSELRLLFTGGHSK